MFLDTQLQTICSNFFSELKRINNEQDQIYYTVLYFIHTAPQLSMLYLKWTNLKVYEKLTLNIQIKQSLSKNTKVVYAPIIRAFEYWDIIQDTYGAPGFNCNPLKSELTEEMDKNIANTMYIMEKTINQINNKREAMKELLSYEDSRNILFNYKWHMLCNNINRRHLTNTIDQHERTDNKTQEEEDYVTDLNGCGDTTWYSNNE